MPYYDLPPGDYQIRVWFNYLFGPSGVTRPRTVRIYPGYSTTLMYEAPLLVFLEGSLVERQPEPMRVLTG